MAAGMEGGRTGHLAHIVFVPVGRISCDIFSCCRLLNDGTSSIPSVHGMICWLPQA